MPKDEFDFDDPMELNGVGFVCHEDTTDAMAECFIEEFLRLGYNHKQILALFRNPHYLGMHMVLEKRGEPFVRERITEVFARWGRTVVWPPVAAHTAHEGKDQGQQTPVAAMQFDATECDPMGAALPGLDL